MIEREDRMERESAVFQAVVYGCVLLRMPGVVDRNDHINSAATEILSALQDMRGVFANDQRANVGKPKDLVERKSDEIGCG